MTRCRCRQAGRQPPVAAAWRRSRRPPLNLCRARLTRLCAARERIIGWYHTGPRLREADLDIHDLIARYCDDPLLLICEVQVRGRGRGRRARGACNWRLAPGACSGSASCAGT